MHTPRRLPCWRRGCPNQATAVVTATGTTRHTARATCTRHQQLTIDHATQATGVKPHIEPLPGAPPQQPHHHDQQLTLDL